MASKALWSVPSYTGVTILSTAEIQTLASAALSCASTVISNSSSSAHVYAAFELLTWITTGTCAPSVSLYGIPSLDLSNPASTQDLQAVLLGIFPMSTATSTVANKQKRIPMVNVVLPASDFSVAILNNTGSAFSSALGSNSLRYWLYDVTNNG